MDENQNKTKNRVLKKLELLANHQKFEQVLAKESDKMDEIRSQQKDEDEAKAIKQKLLNK